MPLPLIRTFSYHYRHKYGYGVGKIPVDLGQPCPNRIKGGCIFCRPAAFTPACLNSDDHVLGQIAAGKKKLLRGRFRKFFAYFQQESCTVLPAEELMPVFNMLLADRDCIGLILSTRPDCVNNRLLELLQELVHKSGKECLFELGLQSVHERSLDLLNRNHSYADFLDATSRIQAAGCFELGVHLILGIPQESEEDMLASVRTVCKLGVNALKLHHLQVIRDTPLHALYNEGKVELFSLERYLHFLLRVLVMIPAEVTIHRLWATAHPALLVAPRWNILAGDLSEMLRAEMKAKGICQGQRAENSLSEM